MSESLTDQELTEAHHALIAGRNDLVNKFLSKIQPASVPSERRLSLAELCRRAGDAHLALQVLSYPIQQKKNHRPAEPAEVAEYCMALRSVGALGEAGLRLSQIDTKTVPEALMCEMYLALNRWDSVSALAACDEYLSSFAKQDEYKAHVVSINRVGALIALGKSSDALESLLEIMPELHLKGWTRLLYNSHELLAQVYLNKEKYDKASSHLDHAESLMAAEGTKDLLFVKRWRAVIAARTESSEEPLIEFSRFAAAKNHHESCRAMDYERSLIHFDQRRFDTLYFGTPFPAYRKNWLSWEKPSSKHYLTNPESAHRVDLQSGDSESFPQGKISAQPLRLIRALVSDFYRPLFLGDLFERVFPDEHYDPETSFQRLHRLIHRTRETLKEKNIPWSILEHDKHYSLVTGDQWSMIIPDRYVDDEAESRLAVLKKHFSSENFSSIEAAGVLGLSVSSAQRALNQGIDSGILERHQFGLYTRYRFCTPDLDE